MSFLIAQSWARGINGFPQGKTTHTPNNRKTDHDQDRHLSDALLRTRDGTYRSCREDTAPDEARTQQNARLRAASIG